MSARSTPRLRALAAAALLAIGCGPPPEPVAVKPPPFVSSAPTAAPAPTAAASAAPAGPLPLMHPCVPNFIVKELHACEPGSQPTDYSAVANAMAAMTSAGPMGPIRKDVRAVQRELQPIELTAAKAARAFLCGKGDSPLDDERAAVSFELGRLYLNANHYEEAAVYLWDVSALDPQTHADVEYTARFLLDAVRSLATSRPECVATYAALVKAVDQHVCQGPGADQRAESCAAIAKNKEGQGAAPPLNTPPRE